LGFEALVRKTAEGRSGEGRPGSLGGGRGINDGKELREWLLRVEEVIGEALM
jgi:hypothetical protein